MVPSVRLMTVTSSTMSYWCTVTYASAYTGSARPVGTLPNIRNAEGSCTIFRVRNASEARHRVQQEPEAGIPPVFETATRRAERTSYNLAHSCPMVQHHSDIRWLLLGLTAHESRNRRRARLTSRACELQDPVEARRVGGAGVGGARCALQVGRHLVLDLQLAHAAPCLRAW